MTIQEMAHVAGNVWTIIKRTNRCMVLSRNNVKVWFYPKSNTLVYRNALTGQASREEAMIISVTTNMSPEMLAVVRAIETRINALVKAGYSFADEPYDGDLWVWKDGNAEVLSSNYEDGSSSTLFEDGKWYYRHPHAEIEHTLIKDGADEVIANWVCHFTG